MGSKLIEKNVDIYICPSSCTKELYQGVVNVDSCGSLWQLTSLYVTECSVCVAVLPLEYKLREGRNFLLFTAVSLVSGI